MCFRQSKIIQRILCAHIKGLRSLSFYSFVCAFFYFIFLCNSNKIKNSGKNFLLTFFYSSPRRSTAEIYENSFFFDTFKNVEIRARQNCESTAAVSFLFKFRQKYCGGRSRILFIVEKVKHKMKRIDCAFYCCWLVCVFVYILKNGSRTDL